MNTAAYLIRRATPDDLAAAKMFLSQNKQGFSIKIGNDSIFIIAEMEGNVVGVAGAELCRPNALVRSVGVLDAWRGNGLASEILCQLFQELKRERISELFLFSIDTGDFWTKKGFSQCEIKELIEHLPTAPQVQAYINGGSIWYDVAWRRELSHAIIHYELSDDDFEEEFQNASLNAKLFTHEAHVRLAWIHTRKYGEQKAIENITGQLKKYVEKLGASGKYNEPLTIAAVKCVHALREKHAAANFKKFIRANRQILTDFKRTIEPFMN